MPFSSRVKAKVAVLFRLVYECLQLGLYRSIMDRQTLLIASHVLRLRARCGSRAIISENIYYSETLVPVYTLYRYAPFAALAAYVSLVFAVSFFLWWPPIGIFAPRVSLIRESLARPNRWSTLVMRVWCSVSIHSWRWHNIITGVGKGLGFWVNRWCNNPATTFPFSSPFGLFRGEKPSTQHGNVYRLILRRARGAEFQTGTTRFLLRK